MSTISKVFTVVNVVLALFLLGTVSAILAESHDYKNKYETEVTAHAATVADMDATIATIRGEKENLDDANSALRGSETQLKDRVANLTAERDRLREDNTNLRASVDGINATLGNLQRQLADVEGRNQALTAQNDTYRQNTAAAETAKMAAEEDRARLEGDIQRLEEGVAEGEQQLTALQRQFDNMTAEREALVARGVPIEQLVGSIAPLIDGAVSHVGDGFVVLDVGEHDGVKVGHGFDIFRGDNYIGRVVVTNVLPDNATANIQITNRLGMAFQLNDKATTRL